MSKDSIRKPRLNEIDVTGRQFGRLTVLKQCEERIKNDVHWECSCSCGETCKVRVYSLFSGITKSCGCLYREARLTAGKKNRKHGMSDSKENKSWACMIQRCHNQNYRWFKDYGGRGIVVCDRWRHSFENFLADMGIKPSPKHSIDRINNDGNYEPGNCRWATRLIQNNNKRTNRMLTAFGKTQNITQWGRETGLGDGAIHARLKYGWTIERALSEPLDVKRRKRKQPC